MKKLTESFNRTNSSEIDKKEAIVKRLLDSKYISTEEAIILLKVINISIDHVEMSSGAKIVGGSDFESTTYPG